MANIPWVSLPEGPRQPKQPLYFFYLPFKVRFPQCVWVWRGRLSDWRDARGGSLILSVTIYSLCLGIINPCNLQVPPENDPCMPNCAPPSQSPWWNTLHASFYTLFPLLFRILENTYIYIIEIKSMKPHAISHHRGNIRCRRQIL